VLLTKPDAFAEPRTWEDCIEFCQDTPELACWNGDYDCQAMLKYLPQAVRARISMLCESQHGLFKIRYVPKKFMKVWHDDKLIITVYDMAQFYNCSLAVAAAKLGVTHQKGFVPKTWYKQMLARLRDPKTRQQVLAYALDDARTLQDIIDRTVQSFAAAGIRFERPFSNAVFAERYFRAKFRYRKNYDAEKEARKAYHGGMIECLRVGHFPRAWYYDIHSAYPSAIAGLVKPDGRWIRDTADIREDAVYAFVRCSLNVPHTIEKSPIPLRLRSGLICYPVGRFQKTLTLTEFRFCEAKGWVEKVHSAIQHIWVKGEYPFREIFELYQKRRDNPQTEYALKIVMNSTYGKMAQVLERRTRTEILDARAEIFDGNAWIKRTEWKEHTSFVYASEITARIRIKVFEATEPGNVIFYATDAVMCHKPIEIPTGPGLGEWSAPEEVSNLVVVGSGVYAYDYLDKTGKPKTTFKLRGFSKNMDLRAMLLKASARHTVPMWVLRNTSLKQSIERPRDLNVLEDTRRVLNVNFDHKRAWPTRWTARDLLSKQYTSEPLIYYGKVKLER
jgi:hypothetical protein